MSNKANINKGIKLTSNVINDVIKIGLVSLCDDAVKVALAIHDDGENHLANKGSYGYGIFHDGKLLKRRTWGRDSSAKDTISSFEPRNKGFEAVQALSQGKIDAVVIDGEPAKTFVAETEGIKMLDEAFTEEEYAIAVKKGNTELLDKINGALSELESEGTLDEIVAKYITAE